MRPSYSSANGKKVSVRQPKTLLKGYLTGPAQLPQLIHIQNLAQHSVRLVTVELDLVLSGSFYPTAFQPTITDKEKTALRERKDRKLEALKETMCGLMARATESLPGLPADEHLVMEAFLFNYSWENTRGLPHRIVFTAQKGKLLDAVNRHAPAAEIAALIEESEL